MPTWCKGSHEGLKIPWTVMSVPVRVRPSVQNFCRSGVMVATPVLGTGVERHVGSSPTFGTKLCGSSVGKSRILIQSRSWVRVPFTQLE